MTAIEPPRLNRARRLIIEEREMTRSTTSGSMRWLWLLLLMLPAMVGYSGSGDPIGAMTEISNRAAKGDRLPVIHAVEAAWTSCAPAAGVARSPKCAAPGVAD